MVNITPWCLALYIFNETACSGASESAVAAAAAAASPI
jgi:hypothetical protein